MPETWLQIKPNNQTVQAPSTFLRRSHLTLLMFRKEGLPQLPSPPPFSWDVSKASTFSPECCGVTVYAVALSHPPWC